MRRHTDQRGTPSPERQAQERTLCSLIRLEEVRRSLSSGVSRLSDVRRLPERICLVRQDLADNGVVPSLLTGDFFDRLARLETGLLRLIEPCVAPTGAQRRAIALELHELAGECVQYVSDLLESE